MLKKLKENLKSSAEKQRLFSNIFSLGILQIANYVMPLLSVPYLLRILGPEYFGLLAFVSATVAYAALISDYGFNLTATQQISIHRNDPVKVNEIFSAVMLIKIGITSICFILLTTVLLFFDKFHSNWYVYILSFGSVVGQTLFPIWIFQGLERMKYITYLNAGVKCFFTGCIFIFIQTKEDYILVPLLASLGSIAAGVLALHFVHKKFKITFSKPSLKNIKYQLIAGWYVFFSSMAISVYTISTTFILGLLTSNAEVGIYSAADKIVQAIKNMYTPISQAIYPLIGKKIHDDKIEGIRLIKKITVPVGIFMFLICLSVFLFSKKIVFVLLGDQYQNSVLILRIMAFLPFVIALSNIFGIQVMLNLDLKKQFSRILIFAAIIGLSVALLLVPPFKGVGTAIGLLIVEFFVTAAMFLYVRKLLWK